MSCLRLFHLYLETSVGRGLNKHDYLKLTTNKLKGHYNKGLNKSVALNRLHTMCSALDTLPHLLCVELKTSSSLASQNDWNTGTNPAEGRALGLNVAVKISEPHHEKTNILPMQKQWCRSAWQHLCLHYMVSTIPLLSKSKICSLWHLLCWYSSGLCRT